jgi:malonate-semialdehyde dehydrogenase (acetylating)/methylmalonate-semialdehyde dehydrogenase
MQGYNSEDIARGIDEILIRQPIGVAAAIAPFNFPGMIPFWFLPYAIACGNTYILKPSEKVPLTMQKVVRLIEQTGLPAGVVNLVNGAKEAVDAILDHPTIRAVSFVGSSPVAQYVYSRAAANGKRVQCQGGAKNPIIILPDADLEMTTRITLDSAFGCAGQRCLAASLAVTVGSAQKPFTEAIAAAAESRVVGFGLDDGVQMGPVINSQSRDRIEGLIQQGLDEGASIVVDGRRPQISGYEQGSFVRPTLLQNVRPDSCIAKTEIFGPVLGMLHVESIDEAIALVNSGQWGNMACLFTSSGAAARKFRYEAEAGNIGINIGVAAPMAFFPFSGWKDSFFGDLHGQGRDAIEFFTQSKVIVERWFQDWTRQF